MDVSVITGEELLRLAETGDVIIIDLRGHAQVKESGVRIRGAVWEDNGAVAAWAPRYGKERRIVLSCA